VVALRDEPVDDCHISVVAVADGWSVQSEFGAAPLSFLSGARAEEKARALAQDLAEMGRDTKVLIHDRNHVLVGTWRYFATETAPPVAFEKPNC
jgi:hypothetical protein